MNRNIIFAFLSLILIGSVTAISMFGDLDLKGHAISNVNDSVMPAECLLENSWVSRVGITTSTCRTINYTALIGYSFPELAGSGNAMLCIDSTGKIYRGNATGCP